MTEALQVLCAHFVQAMGRTAHAEYFSDDDAWATFQEVGEWAERNQGLSTGARSALQNLGAALGLRPGAPAQQYMHALERSFGPCPLNTVQRERIAAYVHAQMNGVYADKKEDMVSLRPEPVGTHVPLKNYEYK